MLVDIQVSSIKTSLSTAIVGSACCHAFRARCTSSRSCSVACRVFFEGQMPFVQLMPQGADLDRDALLRDPRVAMPADLKTAALAALLLPPPHLVNPDATGFQPPRNRRRTFSALQCP